MIDKVKIGAVNYAVKEVRDLHDKDNEGHGHFLHGNIAYLNATISIADNQAHDMKVCTLWHELIHGMLNNAGVTEETEPYVNALGNMIVQVIRDNPALIAYTVNEEAKP